jgi:hypothetical protein
MAAKFSVVEDESEPTPNKGSAIEQAGLQALTLGLQALSQRTVVALSRLFVLLATGSAFALWWRTLPDPTVLQLIGLAGYAIFVLAASYIARRL